MAAARCSTSSAVNSSANSASTACSGHLAREVARSRRKLDDEVVNGTELIERCPFLLARLSELSRCCHVRPPCLWASRSVLAKLLRRDGEDGRGGLDRQLRPSRPKVKNLVLVAAYSSSLRIPYPLSRFSCPSSASGLLRPGHMAREVEGGTPARTNRRHRRDAYVKARDSASRHERRLRERPADWPYLRPVRQGQPQPLKATHCSPCSWPRQVA